MKSNALKLHAPSGMSPVLGLLFAASLTVCLVSCESTEEPLCLFDCTLCTDQQCPPDRCGLQVTLASNCSPDVELAEIAVGQCLEDDVVTPGGSVRLCATVPVNETAAVTVRAEAWVWQRAITCTPDRAGRIVVMTLYCDDALLESEDIVEEILP